MHLKRVNLYPELFPTRERYPFSLAILQTTRAIEFLTPVTFFVGENGTGKSTFLQAMARKCNIHIWRDTEGRRFERNPYEEALGHFLTVDWTDGAVPGSFFSSETHRDFSRSLDNWAAVDPGQLKYFGGKSLMTQSHGQSLMSLFTSRYKIKGLYLSDEPETALSPKSQIRLLRLIRDMSRAGHAQFIIATHSPILLACPGAVIFSFDHSPIKRVEYEETEYYRVYKDFLENRDKFLTNE